jgi:hypothetical protein
MQLNFLLECERHFNYIVCYPELKLRLVAYCMAVLLCFALISVFSIHCQLEHL